MAKIPVIRLSDGVLGDMDEEAYAKAKDRYRPATDADLYQDETGGGPTDLDEAHQQSLTPTQQRLLTEQALRQGLNLKDWKGNLKAAIKDSIVSQAMPLPGDVRDQSSRNLQSVFESMPGYVPGRLPGGRSPEREIPVIGTTHPWRALSNVLMNIESPFTAAVETARKYPARKRTEGESPLDVPGRYLETMLRHIAWPSERKGLGAQMAEAVREHGEVGYYTPPKQGPGLDPKRLALMPKPFNPHNQRPPEPLPPRPPAGEPQKMLWGLTDDSAETIGDIAAFALPVKPLGKVLGTAGWAAKKATGATGRFAFRQMSPQSQEWFQAVGDYFRKGGSMARAPGEAGKEAPRMLIKSEVRSDQMQQTIADQLDQALTAMKKQLGRKPTAAEEADALHFWETAGKDRASAIQAGLQHPNPLVRAYATWEQDVGDLFNAATRNTPINAPYARHAWTDERRAEETMKRLARDPALPEPPVPTATGNALAVDSTKRRWLNSALNAQRDAAAGAAWDAQMVPRWGLPTWQNLPEQQKELWRQNSAAWDVVPDTVRDMNKAGRSDLDLTFDLFSTDPRTQALYRMKQASQANAALFMRNLASRYGVPVRPVPAGGLTAADRAGQFDPLYPKPQVVTPSPGQYRVPGAHNEPLPAWAQAVPGGSRMAVPEEIARFLERQSQPRWVDRISGSNSLADALIQGATGSSRGGILHEWTGLATVARPGYHARNRLNNLESIYEEFGGARTVPGSPGWLDDRALASDVIVGNEPPWLAAYAREARSMGHISPPGRISPTEMSWSGNIPSQRVRKMGATADPTLTFMEKHGPSQVWGVGHYIRGMGELARRAEEMDRAHALVVAAKAGLPPAEAVDRVNRALYSRYAYPEGVRALRQFFPFAGWQFSNLQRKAERLAGPGGGRMAKAGPMVERLSEDVMLSPERRDDVRNRAQGLFASMGPKIYLGEAPGTRNPVYVNNPGTAFGEITDAASVVAPWARLLAAKTGMTREQSSLPDAMVGSTQALANATISRTNPFIGNWPMLFGFNLDPKRGRTVFEPIRGTEGEWEGLRPSYEKAGRMSQVAHRYLERLGAVRPGERVPMLGTVRPGHTGPIQQDLLNKRALDIFPSPFGSLSDVANPEAEVPGAMSALAFLMGGTAGTIDFDMLQQAQNAADREAMQRTRAQETKTGAVPPLLQRLRKKHRR